METIYKIIGGGQRVIQDVQTGVPTKYIKVDNSDWVEVKGCRGQDFSTHMMWCTDLERLQQWANGWAGCEVELVEAEQGTEPFF